PALTAIYSPSLHDALPIFETPLAPMQAPLLDGKKIVLVAIMRAGEGILDGMLRILPSARVGHVGLYRDPKTLLAVEYYFKVPEEDRKSTRLNSSHVKISYA